ncbi:MAG TPA: hypothetical protein VKE69_13385 [Planctomycetota bacterium]|nr:hypothetical protein [Planctomycetota bacterium]
MIAAALAVAALAAAAWCAGGLAVPPREPGEGRAGHAGLTTLAGLCLLAAALAFAGALGAPRVAVTGIAIAVVTAGAVARRRRTARAPRPVAAPGLAREVAALAPFVVLGHVGVLAALSGPPIDHDTTVIWFQKMQEAAEVYPPELRSAHATWPYQFHPHYPRGLAWLEATAWPVGEPDARLVRLVPLLFTLAITLAMANAAERTGNVLGGFLAASLTLAVSDVARSMHVGLSDVPLGGSVLLTGLALTRFRETGKGLPLVAVAAAGAGSIKAEGMVLVLAVGLFVAGRTALRPARWRDELLPAVAILGLAIPWWLRARNPGPGVGYVVPTMLQDPAYFLERLASTPRHLFLLLVDPAANQPTQLPPGSVPRSQVAWAVLASLAVLAPRRAKGIVAWPAVVLLLADFAVYVATPSAIAWHIATSAQRLLVQALPLLALAAILRMTAPRSAAR